MRSDFFLLINLKSSVYEIAEEPVTLNGSEHPQSAFSLAAEVDKTKDADSESRKKLEDHEINED